MEIYLSQPATLLAICQAQCLGICLQVAPGLAYLLRFDASMRASANAQVSNELLQKKESSFRFAPD